MNKRNIKIILIALVGFAAVPTKAQSNLNQENAIKSVIDSYMTSINTLDEKLTKSIWLDAPETSFITPRGNLVGMDNIWKEHYQGAMGRSSTRKLEYYDLSVRVYENTAIAYFYWIFNAEMDGSSRETRGRETIVLVQRDGQWKIAHIHYGSMPATGERPGT